MIPGGPDTERDLISRIPVGRLGKPEDVVEAIMMLVVNSYMTAQGFSPPQATWIYPVVRRVWASALALRC